MSTLDYMRLPPPPDTLDECHKEILFLKSQLHKARSDFAQQIVEREKDRRAARGNIKAVAEENAVLRSKVAELTAVKRTKRKTT